MYPTFKETMMKKDIRWKQRFQNFEKVFLFLKKGCALETYDDLQKAGLVQSFEFTFELAWKTLKDYQEQEGLQVSFPREVIKQSFTAKLIVDGSLWIEMLDKRNELSMTYDQEQAKTAVLTIKNRYLPPLEQVYNTLKNICPA